MLLRIQSEARQDIIGLQQNEIVKEINRQVAVEIESGLAEGRAELEHLRMQLEDIEGSFDSMSSKVTFARLRFAGDPSSSFRQLA